MTRIHQTFRLRADLVSKAKKEAEKDERSASYIYEKAVEHYLEMKEKMKAKNNRG